MLAGDLAPVTSGCRDPDDDHVIAAAIAFSATHIVIGDRDLLDLGVYGVIEIATARAIRAAAHRRREWLDPDPPAGLARQLDWVHDVLQPVAHVVEQMRPEQVSNT